MFYLDKRTEEHVFFIKTREHENKREGEDLLEQNENMRFGWACPTLDACVSSLKPLDFSLFTFHSSLKLLDTSLFVLHSSLKPLDFSLFSFHFSLNNFSHSVP